MATTNYLRFVTAVRVQSPGDKPEHITHAKWLRTVEGKSHSGTTDEVVKHIESDSYTFWVAGKDGPSKVLVIDPGGGRPKFIRTSPNDTPSDNLLSLPRF